MLLEVKKQLEDAIRTQQLLKKLPTQKMIPFNSVCYLEAKIPKQETCIISLEADYAAEVSLTAADQILQRRKLRLEESFHKLREMKTYEEMQHDLGQKIDENQEEKQKNEENAKQAEMQKKREKEIELKQQEEQIVKEKQRQEKLQKEKLAQQEKDSQGKITHLGDDIFEIEESYTTPVVDEKKVSEEKQKLLEKISEAFYQQNIDEYQKYSQQLAEINKKFIVKQCKEEVKIQQVPLEPITEDVHEQEQTQEQPKKLSKFKQDMLKKKK